VPSASAIRAVLATAALLGALHASASPDGQVVRYGGGGEGRVVFDPRVHLKAGLRCQDCHSDLFPTRKLGLISRSDHGAGTRCFGCHDGARAFATCQRCHGVR
jgi:thiosulfate reductase cytochrome b subunit